MDKLKQALEDGVINQDQLDKLQGYVEPPYGEDGFRFFTRFSDVFIAVAVFLLAWVGPLAVGEDLSGAVIMLAIFVGMSEWLVTRHRLTLPGMALLINILIFSATVAVLLVDGVMPSGIFILLAGVALVFYLRYRLPFSLFLIAWLLVLEATPRLWGMSTGELRFDDFMAGNNLLWILLQGVIVFAVAMWFDSRDTLRKTHLSDAAFWLHLAAAPMLVHPVMVTLLNAGVIDNIVLIALFVLLFLSLALLVDRRAMLLSSMLYGLGVITYFYFKNIQSLDGVISFTVIPMLYVFLVIITGVYWYALRTRVFGFVANTPIAAYLPTFRPQPYN